MLYEAFLIHINYNFMEVIFTVTEMRACLVNAAVKELKCLVLYTVLMEIRKQESYAVVSSKYGHLYTHFFNDGFIFTEI